MCTGSQGWQKEQPGGRASLTAGLEGEEDRTPSVCMPDLEKENIYAKQNKNLLNPLRIYIPFKGSIVSHQVMHFSMTLLASNIRISVFKTPVRLFNFVQGIKV